MGIDMIAVYKYLRSEQDSKMPRRKRSYLSERTMLALGNEQI